MAASGTTESSVVQVGWSGGLPIRWRVRDAEAPTNKLKQGVHVSHIEGHSAPLATRREGGIGQSPHDKHGIDCSRVITLVGSHGATRGLIVTK